MSVGQGAGQIEGATAAPAARSWHFATAVLDERKLELSVGGQPVGLDRKATEALRHLLRHAGEVVTKDELLAAVWPGRILSDSALTSCVARLRAALQDQTQEIIKTQHGYGYRLVAPVRITHHHAAPAAHFDFKPGDHPPGRPLWSLLRRLGTGGHGEAWLGAHDKTREPRVFKFAKDEASLGALKREITLFRLLNDSLVERARVVELLDWNLELQPYFVESRYIAGGSLVDWAERHGKLSTIPLATRLDVAAQIADALAAVHSVGVLHKDLKPSNILVEEIAGSAPKVRLADFGSGGLLDAERLEALGITRAGFTHTLKLNEAEGTLLYLAPEVIAGQMPTVKADIYALGVMLYQLVLGDFRTAMSPGWERNIADELLRECIADAAAGESPLRLADAGAVAIRLRTLEEIRIDRRRAQEARQKADALERAQAAAKTSQAVADFLSKDLFSAVGSRPLRELTVPELLAAASAKLTDRFQDMPLAAAQIHAALGNACWIMESVEEAERHLSQALVLYERIEGPSSASAIAVAARHIFARDQLARLPDDLGHYERLLSAGQEQHGAHNPAVLRLHYSLAHARFAQGRWPQATIEFGALIESAKTAPDIDEAFLGSATVQMGQMLIRTGEFARAEETLRAGLRRLAAAAQSSPVAAEMRMFLGQALLLQGRFDEAEAELSKARELMRAWTAADSSVHLAVVQAILGQLRQGQRRFGEAIPLLSGALGTVTEKSWNRRRDRTAEIRTWLANAYLGAGQLDRAEVAMRDALAVSQAADGPLHPVTHIAAIGLAEILERQGKDAEAPPVFSLVDRSALSALGSAHPITREWHRVAGLLSLNDDGAAQGRAGA